MTRCYHTVKIDGQSNAGGTPALPGYVCTLLLFLAGCGGSTPAPLPENHEPIAHLRTPMIVAVNVDVTISAQGTSDPDGDPMVLLFAVAGGESTETRETQWVTSFPSAGQYSVTLTVTDIHGAQTHLTHQITARDEFPNPPAFCSESAPCVEKHTDCERGICYQETVGGG